MLVALAACNGTAGGRDETSWVTPTPAAEDAGRRDDMMGIHQGGPIVQIVRIRAR